jgi:hypothetical protein
LRRKHRRDINGHNPKSGLPQSAAGQEEKFSMKSQNSPATTKEECVPHDCKQYDLPSGALESLDIWYSQAL